MTTTEVKNTRAHAPEWSFHGGPDRASDAAFLVAGVRRIEVAEGLRLQGYPDGCPSKAPARSDTARSAMRCP